MNAAERVKKIRNQRILCVFAGTVFFCLMLMLVFYSLFLIFPVLFIKEKLIAPLPLFIISFLFFLISFAVLYAGKPFAGKFFLNTIIKKPYSVRDVKAALELESGKCYPKKETGNSRKKRNVPDFLSGNFTKKIVKKLIPEISIIKQLFPDLERVVTVCIIILIFASLSAVKKDLVADVFTALKTGLPVELIALGTPLKFEKLEAHVIPPAYLESGSAIATDLIVKNKIKAIQGSSVFLKGYLKNIRTGKVIVAAGSSVEYFTATINGDQFEASFLAPHKGAFALEFLFTRSVEGKSSGKSKVYIIEAMPDQPPSLKIFFPPPDHNLVFGNPVEINFTAADDYGIMEISLFHRNPEDKKDYYKEIVARFPKDPKTNYSTIYAWNPVIREGEKIDELVYAPGTKSVEYYLEVKDNNIFSSEGIVKSDIMHIYFTDRLVGFKDGLKIIRELIDDGNRLLLSLPDKKMTGNYTKKLTETVDIFTKELREIIPQGNLVHKTSEMITVMYIDDENKVKIALKDYIAYLEKLLIFINLIQETENFGRIQKDLSGIEGTESNLNDGLRKIALAAELFSKEFKKDIEEIRYLIARGDHGKAREKMKELIMKISDKIQEEMDKVTAKAKKIADEVSNKLDSMTKQASGLLKEQEKNKNTTDLGKIKQAGSEQRKINIKLADLDSRIERLSSEYPFVMFSLSSYAGGAKIYGEKALQSLNNNEPNKSSQHQTKVIQYLKKFMESATSQKKLMQELAKGNFQDLMPRGFSDRFVLIPKEAIYSIPIDYKNKIIEMSKDRSKSTPDKEAFWKDVLE